MLPLPPLLLLPLQRQSLDTTTCPGSCLPRRHQRRSCSGWWCTVGGAALPTRLQLLVLLLALLPGAACFLAPLSWRRLPGGACFLASWHHRLGPMLSMRMQVPCPASVQAPLVPTSSASGCAPSSFGGTRVRPLACPGPCRCPALPPMLLAHAPALSLHCCPAQQPLPQLPAA